MLYVLPNVCRYGRTPFDRYVKMCHCAKYFALLKRLLKCTESLYDLFSPRNMESISSFGAAALHE